jgi:hypothetical protein
MVRNKKVVSLICAVAVMGSLSMGVTSASAASVSLPKLPALTLPSNLKLPSNIKLPTSFTLPSNTSGLVSSLSNCAKQKSLASVFSCALSAVGGSSVSLPASLPSNLTSLIPSNISSLLQGVNLGNLSSVLGGLIKK